MMYLWILYWLMMLLSFLTGLIYYVKNCQFKWLGLGQSVLTVLTAGWGFAFCLQRNYLVQTEIEFLLQAFSKGSFEARS